MTSAVGDIAVNISTREMGDVYSPMETMMVDGIGTMIGALFGSPYGTTVYIGHNTYKKLGGTRGYSFLNGFMWLIIGGVSLHPLLDAILPHEIILGVLVAIGMSIAAINFEVCPKRWYPAVLIGMNLGWCNAVCTNFQNGAGGAYGADMQII